MHFDGSRMSKWAYVCDGGGEKMEVAVCGLCRDRGG